MARRTTLRGVDLPNREGIACIPRETVDRLRWKGDQSALLQDGDDFIDVGRITGRYSRQDQHLCDHVGRQGRAKLVDVVILHRHASQGPVGR